MNLTSQQVLEIFAAASIMRSLRTTPFVADILACLADGIDTAVANDDLAWLARIKTRIQKQRDKLNGPEHQHIQAALFGVNALLMSR